MSTKQIATTLTVSGFVALVGATALVAQEPKQPTATAATGPFSVAPHWSPYDYPTAIGEGQAYHIVERGDTLWDIAARYMGDPYMWPQVWEANPYVRKARLIYPGDPILLPTVLQAADAGATVSGAAPEKTKASAMVDLGPADDGTIAVGGGADSTLYAGYSLAAPEDETLKVRAIEMEAATEIQKLDAFNHDVLFLRAGASAGLKAGDRYLINRRARTIRHPATGRKVGYKIDTVGIARIVRVGESAANAVVETAAREVEVGDYLVPFAEPASPRIARTVMDGSATVEIPLDTPNAGYVVDIYDSSNYAGSGVTMTIDLGTVAGMSPGKLVTLFRQSLKGDPLSRKFLGNAVVLSAKESFSVVRIVYSREEIGAGDRVLASN